MTEPKQSFTEEVQKEAEKYANPQGINPSKLSNGEVFAAQCRRIESDFLAGAQSALSILSRKTEGRTWYLALDSCNALNCYYGSKYQAFTAQADAEAWTRVVEVVEHSALVAERARCARLESTVEAFTSSYPKLEKGLFLEQQKNAKLASENAALKAEVEALMIQSTTRGQASLAATEEITTLRVQVLELEATIAELLPKINKRTEEKAALARKLAMAQEALSLACELLPVPEHRQDREWSEKEARVMAIDLELQKKGQGDE